MPSRTLAQIAATLLLSALPLLHAGAAERETLVRLADTVAAENGFNGVILIGIGDSELCVRGYGTADFESAAPSVPCTQ